MLDQCSARAEETTWHVLSSLGHGASGIRSILKHAARQLRPFLPHAFDNKSLHLAIWLSFRLSRCPYLSAYLLAYLSVFHSLSVCPPVFSIYLFIISIYLLSISTYLYPICTYLRTYIDTLMMHLLTFLSLSFAGPGATCL